MSRQLHPTRNPYPSGSDEEGENNSHERNVLVQQRFQHSTKHWREAENRNHWNKQHDDMKYCHKAVKPMPEMWDHQRHKRNAQKQRQKGKAEPQGHIFPIHVVTRHRERLTPRMRRIRV